MSNKYGNLVKPFTLKDGPEGLYPFQLFWMEAKDLEGFNAQYSYCIVKEPCVCHPQSGMIAHPYDELLVFGGLNLPGNRYLGADPKDILYLGAEISIELGEEREEYIFNDPTVITIPKGTPHGPVRFRRLSEPVAHYTIGLAPEYKAEEIAIDEDAPRSLGTKYAHLVKTMRTHIDEELISTGLGYEKCCDDRGVMMTKLAPQGMLGPGNNDELFWMFGKDLERFEVNFTWGHCTHAGLWHRAGESHRHPEEEILVFVGFNPDDIYDLGSEVEIGLGSECERQIITVPSVVVCPKGFPHLPQITRWCDRRFGFIVVCLSGEHASPWVEV
jgi:hypothetical protein